MIEQIEEAINKLPPMLTNKQFEEFEEAINRIAKEAQEKLEQERLRDTFAGLGMQSILLNEILRNTYAVHAKEIDRHAIDVIADTAYEIADAMLKARSKKNGN
jgi:hypothetical protein